MVDTKFKKGLVPWNKGKKVPEISGEDHPMFGKHHSEESKKKMSESHKGQIAWNKGMKGSVPWNKGMKTNKPAWNKGKPAPWMKGKHLSEEAKRKLSEFHKGKPSWSKGKHFSEEHKNRIGKGNKGKHHSLEIKRKISLAKIGKKYPGTSERRREIILKRYESGNFPPQLNTKPEREIKKELLKRGYKEGIDFIHQYKFMNKFMCDFCFPKQKIVVEVYGDYWHSNPKIYPVPISSHQIKGIGRDKSKEAYITKVENNTWTYLVLWESDIKKDVVKCVDRIEEVLREK